MAKWLLLIFCALLGGCANEKAHTRRLAISDAQEQMFQRRSERIHARDQRMWEAREARFQ